MRALALVLCVCGLDCAQGPGRGGRAADSGGAETDPWVAETDAWVAEDRPAVQPSALVRSLRVGLYPYVPRLEQFRTTIQAAWARLHPEVRLEFAEWDGGYSSDPSDLDVFVFDAMFLDDFRERGFLSPLALHEVAHPGDFLAYAIDGVAQPAGYAAIPMLGCTYLLFYREGDAQIANAQEFYEVQRAIGRCSYTSEIPPAGSGLMLDMRGGTTNACIYAALAQAAEERWPVELAQKTSELDRELLRRMRSLLTLTSFYDATRVPESGDYGRARWFSRGNGRALMGFSELLSAMSAETREPVRFKPFPFGDRASGSVLFFADVVGVSSTTTQRELAVRLANLMASSAVLVASLQAQDDGPAQYLIPARSSAFSSLSQRDPVYARLWEVVERADPILFNLGPDARSWLESMKQPIRDEAREGYPCGCDQDAGALTSLEQARERCSALCSDLGGWTGVWTGASTRQSAGESDAGHAACRCQSCPATP